MKRPWTLGILAIVGLAGVDCGNSSPPTAARPASTVVKFTLPQQVVTVPSTDPGYVLEATIPVVLREMGGVDAYINMLGIKTTDEATGVTHYPPIVRLNSVGKVPALKCPSMMGRTSAVTKARTLSRIMRSSR